MSLFRVEVLAGHHDTSAFDCGEESINRYLHELARISMDLNAGLTCVAVAPGENRVLGYYTISSGAFTRAGLPGKHRHRMPTKIPTAQLGRLGVDKSAARQGLGSALVVHGLVQSALAAQHIAISLVEVYCLNDDLMAFYKAFGFELLVDEPSHMYLPMATIRQMPAVQEALANHQDS